MIKPNMAEAIAGEFSPDQPSPIRTPADMLRVFGQLAEASSRLIPGQNPLADVGELADPKTSDINLAVDILKSGGEGKAPIMVLVASARVLDWIDQSLIALPAIRASGKLGQIETLALAGKLAQAAQAIPVEKVAWLQGGFIEQIIPRLRQLLVEVGQNQTIILDPQKLDPKKIIELSFLLLRASLSTKPEQKRRLLQRARDLTTQNADKQAPL